jgi:hypothetical protein
VEVKRTEEILFSQNGYRSGFYIEVSFFSKEFDRVVLCVVNTLNVFWIYFSNQIDSYTLQKTPLNHFDWVNQRSKSSYQIDLDNLQSNTNLY